MRGLQLNTDGFQCLLLGISPGSEKAYNKMLT